MTAFTRNNDILLGFKQSVFHVIFTRALCVDSFSAVRLGMMRTAEGCLHYYINGEDQGLAIDGVPPGVYAVIDLYGVCGQVAN